MVTVFEQAEIGSLVVPNRLVMAPVKTAFGSQDGLVTDQHRAYYRRRACGGVGLIIAEPMFVEKRGQEHPKQLRIDGDETIPGLTRLVQAVHGEGALILAHLNHAGRAANPKATGFPAESASSTTCPASEQLVEGMTQERIDTVITGFGQAACRAREAGFDGIELQFGLGYLVAQFLSPAVNQRNDRYGGSLKRRMAFSHALLDSVREAVGEEYPVILRISGDEKCPNGMDADHVLAWFERGSPWNVQALHVVSGSACDSPPHYYQHMSLAPGANRNLARAIKTRVPIPVIVAGRLGDPEGIRDVLESGDADFVALGRPLVADPDLPRKMRNREESQIQICGACLQGCLAKVKQGIGLRCIVNPEVGREAALFSPTVEPGHVVVVGGGPAGMQAALTAHARGHRVTLLERATLGGQFDLAWRAPGKGMLRRSLDSLISRLRQTDVVIREHMEANADLIAGLAPTHVILATGAVPVKLEVPGLERAATGHDLFSGAVQPGPRVLIVGGGMIGVELAEHLIHQGRTVVLVEILDDLARDMDPLNRNMILKRLQSPNLTIRTRTSVKEVSETATRVQTPEGEEDLGAFDTVVVTAGTRAHEPLSERLREKGIPHTLVGDCEKPAQVFEAVQAGFEAAVGL